MKQKKRSTQSIEQRVLAVLQGGREGTIQEIADELDLPAYQVRGAVSNGKIGGLFATVGQIYVGAKGTPHAVYGLAKGDAPAPVAGDGPTFHCSRLSRVVEQHECVDLYTDCTARGRPSPCTACPTGRSNRARFARS